MGDFKTEVSQYLWLDLLMDSFSVQCNQTNFYLHLYNDVMTF